MDYTHAQSKAISTIDSNLQIIACAGSGKTQVISARVVQILKQKQADGIKPANIVAFTFTDKAASELKDRIHFLCKEKLGSDVGLAEMFVGTIHSYCLNLLQSPPLYRYLKYTVLTDVQQRLLIDRNSRKSGLTETPLLKGGNLERWKDSRLYQQVLSVLGESNINLRRVPVGVKAAAKRYQDLLEEKRRLDYTTIIAEAVAEVKTNRAVRKRIGRDLKYLVVDEYQDVNPLQEMLIQELHDLGANLCVVGDDDQTIYQWRSSDVRNIIEFSKRYSQVKQIRLDENFRSSKGVVYAARYVVEKNPERLPKKMDIPVKATATQKFERGDALALEFENPEKEAAWIAHKTKSLLGTEYKDYPNKPARGMSYSDFAILLRSVRRDAGPIIQALEASHMPYIVGGMNELFRTVEVQALQAVFFFLGKFVPHDGQEMTERRLRKILDEAKLGISPQKLSAGIEYLERTRSKLGDTIDAQLYLQRVYLDFLKTVEMREELIDKANSGSRTGEVVYYNLGKFSQVISDFEDIHFKTNSADIYPEFARFLYYQAPDYYPEGWLEASTTKPDAVQVMTVHQAKGMQWPCVFVPCMRQNRFPSRRQGGRSVWHIIPEDAIENVDRYKGTVEDERRLFYVAMTRAEKYLFCSWAPITDNQSQRTKSVFLNEFSGSEYVLTREPKARAFSHLPAKQRNQEVTMPLTFSELKYYFECAYLFKLRFLYGFNPPIDKALGYGKSLHDALHEIHSESLAGRIPEISDIPRLVDDHMHLPFADGVVEANLRAAAQKSLSRYLKEHEHKLRHLEHVEKIIELKLNDGIIVSGRIDLIRRTDTNEIVIVDFKSDERAQAEEITHRQLHVYAVGYEQLTGQRADLIEVHNMDRGGAIREVVDEDMINSTLSRITEAGRQLRADHLPRLLSWCGTCQRCDMSAICRSAEKTV